MYFLTRNCYYADLDTLTLQSGQIDRLHKKMHPQKPYLTTLMA